MSEGSATAQHCPYCGGEDLHPHEASHAAWACRACRRVFAVRLLGLLPPPAEPAGTAPGTTSTARPRGESA